MRRLLLLVVALVCLVRPVHAADGPFPIPTDLFAGAQGGPYAAEIENFWNCISNGCRSFANIQVTGGNVVKTGGGGALNVDGVCLNGTLADACFNYGAPSGFNTGGGPVPAGRVIAVYHGTPTTATDFLFYGGGTVTASGAGMIQIHPPAGTEASSGIIIARPNDVLAADIHLGLQSTQAGYILFGNDSTAVASIAASVNLGQSIKGLNIGGAYVLGFSQTGQGPTSAAITGLAVDDNTAQTIRAVTLTNDGSNNVLGASSIKTNVVSSTASEVIASATTIAPTHSVFHVSGTTTVQTITKPAQCTATCVLFIIPDGLFVTNTAGNIALATTAVVNKQIIMTWDGTKWYPSY